MKNYLRFRKFVTFSVLLLASATLFMLGVAAADGETGPDGLYYISIALCLLPAAACGIVEGLATGKAVESIARNPETAGKVQSLLIMGLALTESSSIYGFAVALILIFVK